MQVQRETGTVRPGLAERNIQGLCQILTSMCGKQLMQSIARL